MRAMPWFRLYHRMIDDEKIRLLAFEDRWHFVALCCLKADGLLDDERGSLWDRKVAVKMGLQARELEEVFRRLREVGLIDEDANPVAWDGLQFKSDRDETAAERQRRKRNKNKALEVVTEASRVTVTNVTATDTDTDTEEEKREIIAARIPKRWVKRPDDVSAEVWDAFRRHRKSAFTEIALQGFRREAAKAGWTLEAAITEAAERGWQGFKADWVKEKTDGSGHKGGGDARDGLTRHIDSKLHARHAQGSPG